jgi:8-oxo-dGTP pyrophosphatase MutT (NUDIX family)
MPEVQVKGSFTESLTALISRRYFANFAAVVDMEQQNYRIYFNEGSLILADSMSALKGIPNVYFIDDAELHKSFTILTSQASAGKNMNFAVICADPTEVLEEFMAQHTVIQAAGGIVFNKDHEMLCIKRNGVWDLPKGKIERHEDQRAAALREVMEETGINHLNISEKVGATYHSYFEDDALLVKETHWYFMAASSTHFTPQQEEGITEVVFNPIEWYQSDEFKSYASVHDIIGKALAAQQTTAE